MNLDETRIHVRLSPTHRRLTYHWTKDALVVLHDIPNGRERLRLKSHHIPHEDVLRISYDTDKGTLYVAYLRPNKNRNNSPLLVVLDGIVNDQEKSEAKAWAQEAMKRIYDERGIKPFRRLLVFVNPHGGPGKAIKIYTKFVQPVLQAAGCTLKVIYTERQGHALDVVQAMALEYDAIVTVSGDGLIHEVLNGLAQRPDAFKALATAVAPIPAGSGNGLSLNLLGLKDGFDAVAAAANVVKGLPMKLDLFSFSQNGKRTISFMSQSLGLMADLDLDTEHLRWMGDSRFMYGFIRGVLAMEPCPVQLSVKVAEQDKDKMAEIAHARNQSPTPFAEENAAELLAHANSLPPLKYLPDDNEGWYTVDDPVLFVYAGQGPYVSRDYMAFPVSLPDDGLIDVSAMLLSTRKDMLAAISAGPTGNSFWMPKLHYFKAHAYRIKPLSNKGNLAIDGERFPFEEFQVEVHPGMGTLLSTHGRFVADFKPRKLGEVSPQQ